MASGSYVGATLSDIAEYVRVIHNGILVEQGAVKDTAESVRKNLGAVAPMLIDRIVDSLAPINETIASAHKVYSKDAHAANWLITDDGRIVSIDNEYHGARPAASDLVKLLEVFPGIAESEKERIRTQYAERQKLGYDNLHLEYCNELIGLTFRTSGSSVSWAGDAAINRNLIHSSQRAIDTVGSRFDAFYQRYKNEYRELATCLVELEKLARDKEA
jgi:thiamine kinase-like enzyme